MVNYDDVGRVVKCDEGLGQLVKVRGTPVGRLAIIKLNTGGTVAKPSQHVSTVK